LSTLGVGLGVGLGLPLLAAIIALTYFFARRKGDPSAYGSGLEKQQIVYQQPQVWPSKPRPEELYGKQIHEISSTPQRAELGEREI
jgi:hypothetical protein